MAGIDWRRTMVTSISRDEGVAVKHHQMMRGAEHGRSEPREHHGLPAEPRPALAAMNFRSIRAGALASAGLVLFFVVVVAGASGSWEHLADQVRQDWYYLVAIVTGFGVQVALLSELRRRHRLRPGAATAGGAGAGASGVGMVACCAHHLADLAPFLGATGAAVFLTDYRVAFMILGIIVTAAGVTIAARRLRHTPAVPAHGEEVERCAVA